MRDASSTGAAAQAIELDHQGLTPEPAHPTVLELSGVTKRFGEMAAVEKLSFSVSSGEFIAVVGPSGSGKSTVLNMIAGLDAPTEGSVRLRGKIVDGPNINVGFMLQKDLLLPWRTIRANVEFGLEARGVKSDARRERALKELARCRLEGFADHYPRQLSGGMRQRAALARTLAIDPDVILLDEPFSSLDAQTKLILQKSFAQTIADSSITTVLITHDLAEAVAMSDRIIVLSERPGRIVEEIMVDLPQRSDPLARRLHPSANDYVRQLFALLKLDERIA